MDSQLQQRFMDIFNDILHHFGLEKRRKVLATQALTDNEDLEYFCEYDRFGTAYYSKRPDLVFLGQDHSLLPRPMDTYTRSMSNDEAQRRELYRGCVVLGNVQQYRNLDLRGDVKLEKVGTCARWEGKSLLS